MAMDAQTSGAASGAMAGAVAGSVFGPVGTVVGALAGGAIGYFGSEDAEYEVPLPVYIDPNEAWIDTLQFNTNTLAPLIEKFSERYTDIDMGQRKQVLGRMGLDDATLNRMTEIGQNYLRPDFSEQYWGEIMQKAAASTYNGIGVGNNPGNMARTGYNLGTLGLQTKMAAEQQGFNTLNTLQKWYMAAGTMGSDYKQMIQTPMQRLAILQSNAGLQNDYNIAKAGSEYQAAQQRNAQTMQMISSLGSTAGYFGAMNAAPKAAGSGSTFAGTPSYTGGSAPTHTYSQPTYSYGGGMIA